MEEQYEMLNSSLIALTTHFAQVQFRLRQIVEAAPDEKEALLKSLEEFAFRGIPEMENVVTKRIDKDLLQETIVCQRAKQAELIDKLKIQLAELESYAYEVGDAGLPQNVLIERQKVIIDQLKGQLNLNVDDIDKMPVDELKRYVDNAVGQLINPLRMKEQLVVQLKTQINDLERFIEFLQGDSSVHHKGERPCDCDCSHCTRNVSKSRDHLQGKIVNIVKRISALLQIFASIQFQNTKKFRRNSPKKSMKTRHWGDLRAQLEVAIENVAEVAQEPTEWYADSDYVSDSESAIQSSNGRLATVVRRQLAVALQNLMQHGLVNPNHSLSVVPFVACFKHKAPSDRSEVHAWEIVLRFYEMKNGEKFNSTPARKLSQSFNLDITGGRAVSAKQSLLCVVGNIIASHDVYKRSYDSQFKALVCAGLNKRMLVPWLKLLLRCQPIIEVYYADWSYVVKSGFEDSFVSLDKLSRFQFNLPVDLAVRQLNDIKDAF
ncbi:hypothetical protein AAG570_000111 [Ranatra chinensis]|uniref:RUN domain-containing protein n=1 Tax=Ranatra chinensis TaxID=642074 RepID=A0ABD0YY91_9HEMI